MSFESQFAYTSEIKAMLYSFGDTKTPSTNTAQRIEKIIQTQIKRFLSACNDVRIMRKGKTINLEDISFVIRKDPFKLQRLLNYVDFKEIKGKIESKMESTESNEFMEAEMPILERKNKKYSWMVEVFGEDTFQLNRLAQIDKITAKMSKEEYLYFTECRQSSFVYRKGRKFKDFIGYNNVNENIIDPLGYICYEMVYSITDQILKNRETAQNNTKNISIEEVDNAAYQMNRDGKLFF